MADQAAMDFSVELPASWQFVRYDDAEKLWAYQSKGDQHRLTVSILYFPVEPTHVQQGQFLREFLQSRKQISSGQDVVIDSSEIEIEEYDAAWVGHLAETASDRRLATTKSIASKVGIATFYIESVTDLDEHNDICRQILATTGFVS